MLVQNKKQHAVSKSQQDSTTGSASADPVLQARRDEYRRIVAQLGDDGTARVRAEVAAAGIIDPGPADYLAVAARLLAERAACTADVERAARQAAEERAATAEQQVQDAEAALRAARNQAALSNAVVQSTSGLVAVPGADSAEIGRVVSWSVTGETDPAALRAAWDAAGLDEDWLPETCSIARAVRLAVDRHKRAGYRVSVSPGRQRGVRVLAVIDESSASVTLTARVVRTNDKPTLQVAPYGHPLAAAISTEWERLQGVIPAEIAGAWIGGLVSRLDGVHGILGSRSAFIPPEHIPAWKQIAGAIEAGSAHRCKHMPALRSDDAVAALAASLADEARATAAQLSAKLAKHYAAVQNGAEGSRGTGLLGPRALAGAQVECDQAMEHLERYETLLDRSLTDIRSILEETKATYVAAHLAEVARRDAEKAKR